MTNLVLRYCLIHLNIKDDRAVWQELEKYVEYICAGCSPPLELESLCQFVKKSPSGLSQHRQLCSLSGAAWIFSNNDSGILLSLHLAFH